MKRIFVSIILAVCALGSLTSHAQFRFGPTAGINLTSLNFRQDLASVDKSVGYSAGIMGELMFPGIGFGIDIGLRYEQRGATVHLGEYEMWAKQGYDAPRLYLHYAEIPIHLKFKYTNLNGFEDTLAPFVFAGPSVGFLVGHSKVDCMSYPVGELGVDMGIGAEICRHWQVAATYNMGMTYALKDKILTNYSARNSTWGLRVTYLF